jgi:hypothetical protein
LLLFLIALGVAVDWESLRARVGSWRDLLDYYEVSDVRAVAAYAAPLIIAVTVIAQQLLSGEAHDAIISIIRGFSTVVPQGGQGGG